MIKEVIDSVGTVSAGIDAVGKTIKAIGGLLADVPDLNELFRKFFREAMNELANDWDMLSWNDSDFGRVRAQSYDGEQQKQPEFRWQHFEDLKDKMLEEETGSGLEIYDNLEGLEAFFREKLESIYEITSIDGKSPTDAVGDGFGIIAAYLSNRIWDKVLDNSYARKAFLKEQLCKIKNEIKASREEILEELRKFLIKETDIQRRMWDSAEFAIPKDYKGYVENILTEMKAYAEFSGNNFLFLYGNHGMGKTVLAKLYAVEYYKSHVLFAEYKGSFKNTIESLFPRLYGEEYKPEDQITDKSACQLVLEALKKDPEETKKWLLVIDNFNNDGSEDEEDKYLDEFQGEVFQKLLDTGIYILITTTITADVVREFGIPVRPIENIEGLYEKKSGRKITETARSVIEKVEKNTLVVTLIAGLIRNHSREDEQSVLDKFLEALEEMQMEKIDEKPDRVADAGGRVKGRDTIYQHMKTVFNVSEITGEKWKVLENAVLLPLSGMDEESFLKLLSGHDPEFSKADIREELNGLINESWISEESTEDKKHDRIFVHPIIREIVYKNERFIYDDCRTYCNNLLAQAKKDKKKDYYKCLDYADNLYENCRCFLGQRPVPFEIIETGYVLTEIYEETEFYLDRIFELTKNVQDCVIEWKPKILSDEIERCRMISGSAYSMLHTDTKEKERKKEECERCREGLSLAAKELRNCKIDTLCEEGYNKWLVRALIHGNMGAYYREAAWLEEGEAREQKLRLAEKEHRRGLKIRKRLKEMYPKKAGELDGFIATAHHCIGRDLADIGDLEEALREHIKAEALRRDVVAKDKENGQKTKWIQSCGMICDTVKEIFLSDGSDRLGKLTEVIDFQDGSVEDLYVRCFRLALEYFQSNRNRREIEKIRGNYEIMKNIFKSLKWEGREKCDG